MNNNSYEQFFKAAQDIKRPEPRVTSTASSTSTERKLRQAVKMRRPKQPMPKKAVAGLVVTLIFACTYVLAPNFVERTLKRIEIRAMGQAEAADKDAPKKTDAKAAEKSQTASGKAEKPAAGETAGNKAKSPDESTAVREELGHYEKLRQRKEELDAREKELSELEEELQRQKVELDKRIVQLDEMRGQIAQTLKDRVEVDQEKVTKLVDLYSNMKPKQAADVINSINEELAVEVLAKMKKKSAAEIMNLLPPDKARVLSEKYTGYRRGKDEPKG